MGTTISAQGGDASLHAGRDLKAEAAKLSASDTLTLEAKGAIDLKGVIDQQSAQTYEKRKSGLNYYSLDASSQDQSLNRKPGTCRSRAGRREAGGHHHRCRDAGHPQ